MQVELGLRGGAESPEETDDAVGAHGEESYREPSAAPDRRPALWRELLWLRAAAFGIDLAIFAGLPLLVSAVAVFGTLLFVAEPPDALAAVFRVAQGVFVIGLLLRDSSGSSPGKRVVGLKVVGSLGRPPGLWSSTVRNLPLLVPGWNLFEAWSVWRRPDALRSGDRAAGTALLLP